MVISSSKVVIVLTAATSLVVAAAHADAYEIDAVHSSAVFKVNHLGASNVYGMMPNIIGTLTFDDSDTSKNAIDISVDATSVSTFNGGRDKHLAGPDFFNSKQFPEITFKSSSWKKDGDEYTITGDFTLLGVSKEITINAKHIGNGKNRGGKDLVGFESTFTIDRTDFGMNYGVAEKGGLGKDVTIIIAIECIKQ